MEVERIQDILESDISEKRGKVWIALQIDKDRIKTSSGGLPVVIRPNKMAAVAINISRMDNDWPRRLPRCTKRLKSSPVITLECRNEVLIAT
jgi:hypothetical protein